MKNELLKIGINSKIHHIENYLNEAFQLFERESIKDVNYSTSAEMPHTKEYLQEVKELKKFVESYDFDAEYKTEKISDLSENLKDLKILVRFHKKRENEKQKVNSY